MKTEISYNNRIENRMLAIEIITQPLKLLRCIGEIIHFNNKHINCLAAKRIHDPSKTSNGFP